MAVITIVPAQIRSAVPCRLSVPAFLARPLTPVYLPAHITPVQHASARVGGLGPLTPAVPIQVSPAQQVQMQKMWQQMTPEQQIAAQQWMAANPPPH